MITIQLLGVSGDGCLTLGSGVSSVMELWLGDAGVAIASCNGTMARGRYNSVEARGEYVLVEKSIVEFGGRVLVKA